MRIPSKIKAQRFAAGLTQAELAEKIGTYQVRLSRIERGSPPDRIEAERIATVLGVDPKDLFGEPGE